MVATGTRLAAAGMALCVASQGVQAFVARAPLQSARSVARRMHVVKASGDAWGEYSTKTCFLFPGQGAQYVGMAAKVAEEVPSAKALFDTASEILGYDLLDRAVNGPKDVLDSTAVSQPAIFVSSAAALEKLKALQGEEVAKSATAAMGLSLGEYSALWYAGVFSFEDGVRLTKARGEAMQMAADLTDTTMVSVIGLESDKVAELCKVASERSGQPIQIANYLCPGNYAVSGSLEAAKAVEEIAKPEFGARMTVRLAVAGAFHTDFMSPAVDSLKKVLASTEFKKPRIPVISNVDAKPHADPAVIKDILARQVTSPVQWETTMQGVIKGGMETAYELGPGKVCAGILKRIDRKAKVESIEV